MDSDERADERKRRERADWAVGASRARTTSWASERMGGLDGRGRNGHNQADGRTGRSGAEQVRSGGLGRRVDKGLGLGLKAAILPPHFTLGRPVCLPCQRASVQGAWECNGVQEDSHAQTPVLS